jgi:hypothetical protein
VVVDAGLPCPSSYLSLSTCGALRELQRSMASGASSLDSAGSSGEIIFICHFYFPLAERSLSCSLAYSLDNVSPPCTSARHCIFNYDVRTTRRRRRRYRCRGNTFIGKLNFPRLLRSLLEIKCTFLFGDDFFAFFAT